MRCESLIGRLQKMADDTAREHGVRPESLNDGGELRYMNGNDGTSFDVRTNDRLCEFTSSYESGYGCVTLYVCNDGTLSVYYWPDGVYIASGSDCQCNLPFISDEAFQTLRNVCGRADARAQWDELVSIAMGD